MEIKKTKTEIPVQVFNGKEYYRYNGERYFTKGIKKLHRVVWEYHNGSIPKGYHIHHIDGVKSNNDISNLELIDGKEHLSLHAKEMWENNREYMLENFSKKGQEASKEWHRSDEGRKRKSEISKKAWKDGKYITTTKVCQLCDKEYETYKPESSKYCHNNCKAKALRKRRREG